MGGVVLFLLYFKNYEWARKVYQHWSIWTFLFVVPWLLPRMQMRYTETLRQWHMFKRLTITMLTTDTLNMLHLWHGRHGDENLNTCNISSCSSKYCFPGIISSCFFCYFIDMLIELGVTKCYLSWLKMNIYKTKYEGTFPFD